MTTLGCDGIRCPLIDGRMAVVTAFADGTYTAVVPEADDDTIAKLHDVTHSLVAQALGLPHSPALWMVAHQGGASPDLVAYEEAAVLAIAEYARALEIPSKACSVCDGEGYIEEGDSSGPTDWPLCPACTDPSLL